jgi:hypothetical protein
MISYSFIEEESAGSSTNTTTTVAEHFPRVVENLGDVELLFRNPPERTFRDRIKDWWRKEEERPIIPPSSSY